jgi:hypothetical protein
MASQSTWPFPCSLDAQLLLLVCPSDFIMYYCFLVFIDNVKAMVQMSSEYEILLQHLLFLSLDIRQVTKYVSYYLSRHRCLYSLKVTDWMVDPLNLGDLAFVKLTGLYKHESRRVRPIPHNIEKFVVIRLNISILC